MEMATTPINETSKVGVLGQHGHKGVDAQFVEDLQHSQMLAKEKSEISEEYFKSTVFIGTMISMSLTVVSSYFGFAVPAGVITFINADIGPSENASLYSIIWSLCNAIGLLLTGRLSDKFGRRYFVLGAGALAIVGGIVACTAQTMNTLIGANVIIGLASGVHSSQTLFTGELLPHEYKFLAVAAMLVPMVTSTGLAAYVARALVETRNWRWIYYIYLILVGSGWIIQIFVYHPPDFQQLHGPKRTKLDEVKRIDFVGIFLLVAGLVLFLLGISWGGNPKPWTSGLILGLLISGVVTLMAFVIYEAFTTSPNPFIDLNLFRNVRGFVCLNIISASAGAIYIALNIIWPQQVVLVYSADNKTWRETAWMSTTIGWGIWSGIMILFPWVNRIRHIRWQILGLILFSVAFTAALSSVDRYSKSKAIAFSFLTAFPIGWLESGTTLLVQLDVDDLNLGMAYAVLSGLRSVSGAVFTAVFVAILDSKSKSKIASHVPPAVLKAGLPASSLPQLFKAIQSGDQSAFAAVPGITSEVESALSNSLSDAYAAAFAYVYYAALAVGGAAVIAALFLKNYDKLLTGHVARQVYKQHDELKDEIVNVITESEKPVTNEI